MLNVDDKLLVWVLMVVLTAADIILGVGGGGGGGSWFPRIYDSRSPLYFQSAML